MTVLVGDCRALLATLPAGSVQCCVTSPPYYGLRDYGHAGQMGMEATPEAYVAGLVAVFRDVRRVLRDDGVVWLNLGDSYARGGGKVGQRPGGGRQGDRARERCAGTPANRLRLPGLKAKDLIMIPARVALALQADGWWLRSDTIWHKPNPMPESTRDRPTSAHEHVFLLSKRKRYFYDPDAIAEPTAPETASRYSYGFGGAKNKALRASGIRVAMVGDRAASLMRNARNVWSITTRPYQGAHFATMPPELAERCILAGTSAAGQCPHCAAPWTRVVVRTSENRSNAARAGTVIQGKGHPSSQIRRGHDIRNGPCGVATTTGWASSCVCPEHEPVEQMVLDPFGGSGTTGVAAQRLGRASVLLELNADYGAQARERIALDLVAPARRVAARAQAPTLECVA